MFLSVKLKERTDKQMADGTTDTIVSTETRDIPVHPKKKEAPKTLAEKISDKIYWILRCAVVINIIALFFPSFNPARLSGMINKNLSLFSCGISYKSIVANFGRADRAGCRNPHSMHLMSAQ